MTRQLFIYWKADARHAETAAAGVAALQQALMVRHAGLVARLYRRVAEAEADEATLMETYACPGGISADLQAEIVATGASAAAGWCRGERHVEVFDELRGDAAGQRGP